MRKIKTFLFIYISKSLNKSLKDKSCKFYRLNKHLNEDIKKDFNENLLNRTIYDIYKNPDKSRKTDILNKKLIDKIYKEKTETETIKILEIKYIDILNIIRNRDLNYFLNKIKEKEIKNGNNYINSYMEAIEDLLFNYEIWFENKKGRKIKDKTKVIILI